MNKLIAFCSCLSLLSCTTKQLPKTILLEQLKASHYEENWFVPINKAIEGLSEEQANWKDSSENHSIAEIISHLVFWNEMVLDRFNGKNVPNFAGNNKITFEKFNQRHWEYKVKKIDSLQTSWETALQKADPKQLKQWHSEIANISSHNAYHTGQIIYIRKMNNWWKGSDGVK